jgi:hypothetical protein
MWKHTKPNQQYMAAKGVQRVIPWNLDNSLIAWIIKQERLRQLVFYTLRGVLYHIGVGFAY